MNWRKSAVIRALAVACGVSSAALAALGSDPVEGMWAGKLGVKPDWEDFGLEFRANESGEIRARLTMPVMNYFGLEASGVVEKSGESYAIKEFGVEVKLEGGALKGIVASGPVELSRVERLPVLEPVPGFQAGPKPAWKVQLGAAVYAAVAVRQGMAYVGTVGGVFQAIRLSDHAIAWTFNAGRPIFGEALATEDGVYFVCDSGYLFRLDPNTGKEAWRYDLGDGRIERVLGHTNVFEYDEHAPQPVIADGMIYVGAGDGGFHAVDAASGKKRWNFDCGGKIRTAAAADGERVYVGTLAGKFFALSRNRGEAVWSIDAGGAVTSTPALIGGKLLIGTRGSVLRAVEPASGAVIWKKGYWGSWVESTPAPFGQDIIIGSSDLRRVTRHALEDGSVRWRTDVYGWSWGKPAIEGGRVYVGTMGVEPYLVRHLAGLMALDASTGQVLWRWAMPGEGGEMFRGFAGGPVIEKGVLVIGGLDGVLYGFNIGS